MLLKSETWMQAEQEAIRRMQYLELTGPHWRLFHVAMVVRIHSDMCQRRVTENILATHGELNVGYTWTDAKGRTWEIIERLPFGMFRVRTTNMSRVGELSGREIRAISDQYHV